MAKKKREEAHGGHGWFVTFADLMALLLAFFVMLVAFSTQDSAQAEDRRGLDARSVRRADRVAIFRNRRIRRPADAAEAEERRAYFARGILQYPDAGREGPSARMRRPTEGRSRVRARLGLVAPGAAGHAGTDRNVQAHHVRGNQRGPQSRNRRPGWPLDVRRRLQGALRPHPPADPETGRAVEGDAAAGQHCRPHRRPASCRRAANMARSICRRTAPTSCARSSNARGCRHPTSSPSAAGPTASHCFPTIRHCRQTVASPSH